MLYYLIRPFARFGLLAFCKKIYVSGAENIKTDRPVILAANHPTAFLEPCILACFLPAPIHFMVRADFFSTPFYAKLMRSLHLIPIHRRKHAAYKDLKQNFDLLEVMQSKLHENKTLMVLVEGSASVQKQLRPLQKGIARLAFGTYERYQRRDIEIVPVSVNFDYPTRFRLTPMIVLGEPILLSDYLEQYQIHKSQTINQLMKSLTEKMRQHLIHIEDLADESLLEQLLEVYRNQYPTPRFPIFERHNKPLEAQIKISTAINHLPIPDKQILTAQTTAYFSALQQLGLSDYGMSTRTHPLAWLGFLIGLVPFLIGYCLNFLFPVISKTVAEKKVKKIQYFIPIYWAMSSLTYLFYFLLLLLFALFSGNIILIAAVLLMPWLGYFAILYQEAWGKRREIRIVQQCSAKEKKSLIEQRNHLVSYLSTILAA